MTIATTPTREQLDTLHDLIHWAQRSPEHSRTTHGHRATNGTILRDIAGEWALRNGWRLHPEAAFERRWESPDGARDFYVGEHFRLAMGLTQDQLTALIGKWSDRDLWGAFADISGGAE